MDQQPIRVYTSDRAVQEFISFVNVLSENLEQPVQLHGLSELPAPNLSRRQQKRAELVGLRAQLEAVLYFIGLVEQRANRFPDSLVALRRERDDYELRILTLEQELGIAQKGG